MYTCHRASVEVKGYIVSITSLLPVWILETELRSASLETSVFSHWAILPAQNHFKKSESESYKSGKGKWCVVEQQNWPWVLCKPSCDALDQDSISTPAINDFKPPGLQGDTEKSSLFVVSLHTEPFPFPFSSHWWQEILKIFKTNRPLLPHGP